MKRRDDLVGLNRARMVADYDTASLWLGRAIAAALALFLYCVVRGIL